MHSSILRPFSRIEKFFRRDPLLFSAVLLLPVPDSFSASTVVWYVLSRRRGDPEPPEVRISTRRALSQVDFWKCESTPHYPRLGPVKKVRRGCHPFELRAILLGSFKPSLFLPNCAGQRAPRAKWMPKMGRGDSRPSPCLLVGKSAPPSLSEGRPGPNAIGYMRFGYCVLRLKKPTRMDIAWYLPSQRYHGSGFLSPRRRETGVR